VLYTFRLAFADDRCPLVRRKFVVRDFVLDSSLFVRMYPKKTLFELNKSLDDGLFVVSGVVAELSQIDQWWYAVCDCQKILRPLFGAFYCHDCHRSDFNATSKYVCLMFIYVYISLTLFFLSFDFVLFLFRCKLKVVVNDGCGAAVFVFLDHLLYGIHSLNFDVLVSLCSLFVEIFSLYFIFRHSWFLWFCTLFFKYG